MISLSCTMFGCCVLCRMDISDSRLSCSFLLSFSVQTSFTAAASPLTRCTAFHTTAKDPEPILWLRAQSPTFWPPSAGCCFDTAILEERGTQPGGSR